MKPNTELIKYTEITIFNLDRDGGPREAMQAEKLLNVAPVSDGGEDGLCRTP